MATHIATVSGYWFHGVNLPDLGWPNFNGLLLLGPDASPLAQFWAGADFHMFTGICFALFYAFIVHPRLPGPNTMSGNLKKALLFGIVLATLSAAWWVPQLFNQQADLGWFSQNVGKVFFGGIDGWKPIAGIYLWHIIYGVNLGLIYNPSSVTD